MRRKRREAREDRRERRARKERVLHTRVSEDLDEELKQRAADLGMSVSNLVRNLLSNTVDMVEEIVQEASQVADEARQSAEQFASGVRERTGGVPRSRSAEVLGWQPLVLNLNAICKTCNEILPKGTQAAVSVFDRPTSDRQFLCTPCVDKLQGKEANDGDAAGE